jgi:glycosyltransferase involved in cell wall biosynthesis
MKCINKYENSSQQIVIRKGTVMYITQCIIAKNEEKNIEYCLSHLKSVVDEQIVIDTGSTDRTVELAETFGAKVFHFDWIDDFSAARNYAIDKAKGDWIIFLDCDEYFSDSSIPIIKKYIRNINSNTNIDGILSEFINIDCNNNVISRAINVSPRIFRKKINIRYKNKVHEFLADEKREKLNFSVVCSNESNNLKILHTGYDKKIVKDKNKNKRNINLLKKELDANPEDSHLNLYISMSLYMNQQYKESLNYAFQALKYMDSNKDLEYYPTIYSSILYSMHALNAPYDKMKTMFDEATIKYLKYPDYYRAMGLAALRIGDIKEAIRFLEKCIHYCSNYNSNIESIAFGQIENVYSELLGAYILDNNKTKIVEISVVLLNANKYEYDNLTVLIITLLTQENEEAIIKFLSKMYDYKNFKDKIYLLKSSKASDNEKLINYYKSLLNEEELKAVESL